MGWYLNNFNSFKHKIVHELLRLIQYILTIIHDVDKYNAGDYLKILEKRLNKIKYKVFYPND